MRKLLYFFSLIFFLCLSFKTFHSWQTLRSLKKDSLVLKDRIDQLQNNLIHLNALQDVPLDSVEDNYTYINKQLNKLNRLTNLKALLEMEGLQKDGLIEKAVSQTSWPGIEEVFVKIIFYDLKGTDQFVTALNFLETMERGCPLSIVSIRQKRNLLEAALRVYGR